MGCAVVGSLACRVFRKETSRLLRSHPKHSSLDPWSQHSLFSPCSWYPVQLHLSVLHRDPPCIQEPGAVARLEQGQCLCTALPARQP